MAIILIVPINMTNDIFNFLNFFALFTVFFTWEDKSKKSSLGQKSTHGQRNMEHRNDYLLIRLPGNWPKLAKVGNKCWFGMV
jgi:hypothetical protein